MKSRESAGASRSLTNFSATETGPAEAEVPSEYAMSMQMSAEAPTRALQREASVWGRVKLNASSYAPPSEAVTSLVTLPPPPALPASENVTPATARPAVKLSLTGMVSPCARLSASKP